MENTQKPKSLTQKPRVNGTNDKARLTGKDNNDKPRLTGRDNRIQTGGIKRSFESLKQGETKKRSAETLKEGETTTRSFESWKQRETTRNESVFSSRKTVSRRANKLPETDLWSDKYTPKSQVSKRVVVGMKKNIKVS